MRYRYEKKRGNRFRWRHARGYGIHSPFVYQIARGRLSRAIDGRSALYGELLARGVGEKTAREIENLREYLSAASYRIPGDTNAGEDEDERKELTILLPGAGREILERFCERVCAQETEDGDRDIVVALRDKGRAETCRLIAREGRCLSIDKRGFFIFIHDRKLPVQHFKL